jgi:pilus assembly protein Flp/PilA
MFFLTEEEGQGLIEYALLILMIAIAVIFIFTLFGTQVGNLFSTINYCLPSGGSGC